MVARHFEGDRLKANLKNVSLCLEAEEENTDTPIEADSNISGK